MGRAPIGQVAIDFDGWFMTISDSVESFKMSYSSMIGNKKTSLSSKLAFRYSYAKGTMITNATSVEISRGTIAYGANQLNQAAIVIEKNMGEYPLSFSIFLDGQYMPLVNYESRH